MALSVPSSLGFTLRCRYWTPNLGSEVGLVIYLKPLHTWKCHTVVRSLEWRDLYAVSPLALWEVISYNLRARLQEWEEVSLWSLAVSLPTRWVTGNAWVLIFSPVAAIRLKPLAGKRLKRGDKHVNLPRPSPSAAASVPLRSSRDVAFPGSSGRTMLPLYLDGIPFKPFHY